MIGTKTAAAGIILLFSVTASCISVPPEEHDRPAISPVESPKEIKPGIGATGGFLGTLAADSIGEYSFEKKKTKEDTARKYKYNPSRGILIRIENTSIVPSVVKAGESIDIKMTYALLGAAVRKDLTVTETRDIRHKNWVIGKPKAYVTHEDGTYSSSVTVKLPPDIKKGQYKVIFTVQTHKANASKEAVFYVK